MLAMKWTLPLPLDFDYDYCLRYLARSPLEKLHRVEEGHVLKVIPLEARNVWLDLSVAENQLVCETPEQELSLDEKAQASDYVREWWDLDRDLSAFYALAQTNDLLSRVVLPRRGLRLIGVPDLFEAICWSIIGQQINLLFAYQLKGRLVEAYGEQGLTGGKGMERKGGNLWLFPGPERIAGTTVEKLHQLQITRRKCEYLIGMAEVLAREELSRQSLWELGSVEAAAQKLISYRGIGPWSAHYVLMRCLRYADAYPVGDAGLQNSVRRWLKMERKPSEAELEALAKDWQGWKAYATFYLWQADSSSHN
jgi:DNA-3-methyladenine glycosylase II